MSTATSTQHSWTVGSLLQWTEKYLAQKGAEFPRLDAQLLLAHVLGCKRVDLYGLRHGEGASDEVRQKYKDLIRRRIEGCPVAYLIGRKEFFSLEFEVTPAVLIPRPDSEMVVMTCLDHAKFKSRPRILDIGTGSGNLAVAIARQLKGADVTAIDISADALAVAQRNAARHGVAERVRFLHGDLFTPLTSGERFDFIVSNPPYIPSGDIAKLACGVRDYEPHLALDGGADGFTVLERLVGETPQYLEPGGQLIVETGAPQEAEARRRFERRGCFTLAPTIYDYAGHPRVLKGQLR